MKRRTKHLSVRDGNLIPLGNNFAYVLGDHPNKVDDVDIGPNNRNGLSVNHGEIMQFGGNGVRVFSAEPILDGISPSKLVQAGMNPNAVFAAQERYKDIHKLNDDGSKKARFGDWFRNLFNKNTTEQSNTVDDDTPSYYGGMLDAAGVTAELPKKFHGSQAAAARYAEGYRFGREVAQKRDKIASNAIDKALEISQYIPGPIGTVGNILNFEKDIINKNYAGALINVGLGAATYGIGKGINWLIQTPFAKKAIAESSNLGRKLISKLGYELDIPSKPNSNYRIVGQSAINDANTYGVIRARTGLHADTQDYLKKHFNKELSDIPNWETKTAEEIRQILSDKGVFNNLSNKERYAITNQIRNSTNHGESVHFFKGSTYPNIDVTPQKSIIVSDNLYDFVPGHAGKRFDWDVRDKITGSTLLTTSDGRIKYVELPANKFYYYGFDNNNQLWKKYKFQNHIPIKDRFKFGKLKTDGSNYYRVLNEGKGVNDAFTTGVYRGNPTTGFDMPYFSKGKTFVPTKNKDIIIEIAGNNKNLIPFKITEPHSNFKDIKFPDALDLSNLSSTDAISFLNKQNLPNLIPMSEGKIFKQGSILGIPYTKRLFKLGGNATTNNYATVPLQGNPLYDITGETKYSDYTNEPIIDFSGIETTNKRPYNVANAKTAYDYFKAQGANDYQIAALLANAIEESGIEPYALDKTDTYYGISQWDKSRYSAARKSKKDKDYSTEIELKDLNDQLSYYYNSVMNGNTRVDWNHGGKGSGYNTAADARQAFKDAASVDDAVKALVLGYVRPTGGIDSYKNRAKVAEQIYKLISKQ